MKLVKKVLAGVAVAAAMASSANASNITVGGITWDPDFMDVSEQDFGLAFNYTQWFSTTSSTGGAIGATSFSTAITLGTVIGDIANGGAFGTGVILELK